MAWLYIVVCCIALKMEPQPTEILEHIFKQLPNLKAVQIDKYTFFLEVSSIHYTTLISKKEQTHI